MVYSHDGPIGRRTRGYILTTVQADAGRAGIFSRRTNHLKIRPAACTASTAEESAAAAAQTALAAE
eukprot:4793114-Pyramimonas_sp.AAC.1